MNLNEAEKAVAEIVEAYVVPGNESKAKSKILSLIENRERAGRIDENESMKESVTHGYSLNGQDRCHNHDKHVPQCYGCREAKWGNVFCKKFEAIIDERLSELQKPNQGEKET